MNLTQLLLRALENGSEDDRVRFMAEVGRLIESRVRELNMWAVENGPRYFGFEGKRWSDIYPSNFEMNLSQYATAEPTTDFFLGSTNPDQPAPTTDGASPPSPPKRKCRFEEAFEGGRLGEMARRGDDIGGYLATMVRNYLHERQKSQDPVGYKVFKNLEAVTEELETAQVLEVAGRVGPRRRIRPSSLVRFRGATTVSSAPAPVVVILAAPTMVGNAHKLAKKGRGAQRLLCPAVESLPAAGIAEFQFGDLLAPLQRHVREAARVWFGESPVASRGIETGGAKNLEQIRMVDPAERYTLGEHLELLAGAVRAAIDQGEYQDRTRRALRQVFDDWIDSVSEAPADGGNHPSLDDWAPRLGLKRSTLWEHLERLRAIIARVNEARAGDGP